MKGFTVQASRKTWSKLTVTRKCIFTSNTNRTDQSKANFLRLISKLQGEFNDGTGKNREPLTVYNGMDSWLDHSSFTNKLVLNIHNSEVNLHPNQG